jgi:pyruvate dehydrogenase E2 component (dihydrolipoamide acetyltransferase)
MATEVILPRVDMDMETGKFSAWLVQEGETVKKGQPLFEIETDKAAMEVEAPAAGVLKGIAAAPGDVLPVGATVAWIAAADENVPVTGARRAADAPEPPVAPDDAVHARAGESASVRAPGEMEDDRSGADVDATTPSATPLARRLAREAGVDLASGPSGRIQARDIASATPAISSPETGKLYSEWFVRGQATPIVLVHGFGGDSGGWRALVSRLGGQRPILAFDLPGHGRSDLEGATKFSDLVDAVELTAVEQGIHRGHWVAHSLGAAIVASLADRRAGLVASLSLLAPAGLGPEINWTFVQGFLRARSEASLSPILRMLVEDEAALGGALVKTTLRQRQQRGLESSQATIADLAFPDGVQAIDVRAALSAYPGPIKLVAGRLDRIIPAHHAKAVSGNVGVHLLERVGHMPHLEARDLVARLVLDNVAAGERAA